jgi:malate dehydrogenase (oxaloacetate-decarboxylating)(NADP+)
MHVDAAFSPEIREKLLPEGRLEGQANLLVLPNLDAANTAYNLTRVMSDGIGLGPVLMGMGKPAHVLTPSSTVRRVVNMTAIAAVEAQIRAARGA